MKITKLLFLLALIFTGFSFTSCSDDDEVSGGAEVSEVFGPKRIFKDRLLTSYGGYAFSYNSDSLLYKCTAEESEVTFEYPAKLEYKTDSLTVVMNSINHEHPVENYKIILTIGSNGFVKEGVQILFHEPNDTLKWEFRYNKDGQLDYFHNKTDKEETILTYENGNVIKIVCKDGEFNNTTFQSNLVFTSPTYPKGIENKGSLMVLKELDLDLEGFWFAYYAGLLGNQMKNLPVGVIEEEHSDDKYTDAYKWIMNDRGYPIKMYRIRVADIVDIDAADINDKNINVEEDILDFVWN